MKHCLDYFASYLARIVSDPELHGAHSGPGVQLVEGVVVVALLQEGHVCGLNKKKTEFEIMG